ncbi:Mettl9 [Symbiodinium sp. CCMP2456]|nr:Mettl9 [Symbiodinium sp. CCMP2456]
MDAADAADAAEASLNAWHQLRRYHGVASGAIGADEHLAGRAPHRGTELCVVVESMRSLEEAYAAMPNRPELADSLEVLAFNSLPAAVSDDHWTHQYLTQSNAAFAGIESVQETDDNDGPRLSKVFGNVGVDATLYGLSPNFPCCTVNFAQGWAKFVASGLWLFEDGGRQLGLHETPLLLSAAFAPSSISVPEPVGGEVELSTAYPFDPEGPLRYTARGIRPPLQLLVRVPQWADLERSEAAGARGTFLLKDVATERPSTLGLLIEEPNAEWEVRFVPKPLLREGVAGASIQFGPLMFVQPISHRAVPLPLDDGPYGPGAHPPPAVRDEMLVPLQEPEVWSLLLNETWEKDLTISAPEGSLKGFQLDGCPTLALSGHRLEAFGCTKLRFAELPIFVETDGVVQQVRVMLLSRVATAVKLPRLCYDAPNSWPSELLNSFLPLGKPGQPSPEALRFLDEAPRATLTQTLLHRSLCCFPLDDFDVNAWFDLYPLHLFSRSQLTSLLAAASLTLPIQRGLDIGAGAGGVSEPLREVCRSLIAVETSRAMARTLRNRGRETWCEDLAVTAAARQAEGEEFQLVALLNVLDRCAKPRSLLAAARLLMPRGSWLLLATPLPFHGAFYGWRTAWTGWQVETLALGAEASWAGQAQHLIQEVLPQEGFEPVVLSRLPYLCAGDAFVAFSELDDLIVLARKM